MHRTALEKANVVSVYFSDAGFTDPDIRVLRASPMLREMLVFADRWKVDALNDLTTTELQLKESFFSLFSKMFTLWLQETLPYHLPRPKSERLEKAINFLLANLDSATMEQASQVSSQSVRTLHRSMASELKMTWKDFLRQARLLEAMDALLTSERSILDISLSVGYESPSAFTKAFHHFTGSKPLEFRKTNWSDGRTQ
jgi:AraC-like DNA-binding protein